MVSRYAKCVKKDLMQNNQLKVPASVNLHSAIIQLSWKIFSLPFYTNLVHCD